jgi:hypothetical protein
MILSQLSPHRLAAQPSPRRAPRLHDKGADGAARGSADGAGAGADGDGDAGMKEVASLQVGPAAGAAAPTPTPRSSA